MKEQIGKVQLYILEDEISASNGLGAAKISGNAVPEDSVRERERADEKELMEILRTCPEDQYRSVLQERKNEF